MTALLWAGAISFSVAIFGMPVLIRWLASRGIGQPIRADGPQAHIKKSGTPTMGGIMIVIAAVSGYMIPHFVTDAVPFSGKNAPDPSVKPAPPVVCAPQFGNTDVRVTRFVP